MYLIRVTDHDLAREFIRLPTRLSHPDKVASKSQQKYVKSLLNRTAVFFQHGEAEFWVLTNFRGETIGRIAALVEYPKDPEKVKGYIGLFDCINHLKGASLLFEECKVWLKRFGVKSIQGPISLLPFQLDGIAADAGLQQATPFFSSQAAYLAELYEANGFNAYNTQQLLSFEALSSFFNEEHKAQAEVLLTDPSYTFLKVNRAELKTAAQNIQTIYSVAYAENLPIPSTEDIAHCLHLLFEQHLPPLIWIAYHKSLPIAFLINTHISSSTQLSQNTTVWQQLLSRFTNKNKSLLNLGMMVHPEFQSLNIPSALFSKLDEALENEPSTDYASFLLMSDKLERFNLPPSTGKVIDQFVKFEYRFDQEATIDTFATKNVSRN